ncbi:MAG TPA: hypothetical protein VFJ58_08425 [Armatimonadota bacterium]|nr:hypothetical protein [Armatimonadota bacterium]
MVLFFLNGIIEQARDNQARAGAIIDLYRAKKEWMVELTRSQYAVRALDWLFGQPIFNTADFVSSSDIPRSTAIRILRLAREGGLFKEIRGGKGRRAAIMAFPELLNVVEGRSVL